MQHSGTDPRPKQARALHTEQRLIDALEKLLANRDFATLTVSELAGEAGLTTGAIYRRFEDKEDLLRTAFHRFIEERTELYSPAFSDDLSDYELLKAYFRNVMNFLLRNAALMRAANNLDDHELFDNMIRSRQEGSAWLAGRLRTSQLSGEDLRRKCGFVLRVVTATFRDTFISGHGSSAVDDQERAEYERRLDRLCTNLADMACSYLKLKKT